MSAKRTERATVALTAGEKEAVRLVAAALQSDESALIRNHTIAQIVERARKIRAAVEKVPA